MHAQVLVRTPARTYTVQQLPELLAAIGDDQAASFYNQVHRLDERLSMGSLLENVTMFSIYGRNVSTPKTWSFPSNIRAGVPTANGSVALWGEGDGIVNLESLRLCNRSVCTGCEPAWIGEDGLAGVDGAQSTDAVLRACPHACTQQADQAGACD